MAAPAPISKPTRADWFGWGMVALGGGSAPSAINLAIETAPPTVVATVRLWSAAALLLVYILATGRPMASPLSKEGRSVWLYAIAAGFMGYAMPFLLFPYAQLQVSSIMAGIVMAFLPVMAVIMAAAFAGEPMTRRSLTGVLVGSTGVLFLIGPALLGGASGTVAGIVMLLMAVFGYASLGVIMRRAPEFPARSFAAMMMLAAAIMSTPAIFISDLEGISAASWAAIAYLGIVPTGINAILIVATVRRAGAAFLSTSAYASPVLAVFFGILFFSEPLHLYQVLGLLTILTGIALTQNAFARLQKTIVPRIVTTAFPNRKTRSPESRQEASPPRADA
ncbi:DMT family transporter [Parvularcula lutaonensis]|uniref:DMT family transporter n=1 Tax=Parvularcula lutaonensis TaxID=491923 RepID=A0ABV7MEC2_9PROT|nr:DMT family transporter [Parvularcula lutaonensis]GGY51495.1 multidrug transporter [Parvularcula lutaonensis]